MDHAYSEFRDAVKDDLRKSLAVWKLSEDDLEAYVAQNEDEVKSAYEHYLKPQEGDQRKDDVRFKSDVATIAYTLQLSY